MSMLRIRKLAGFEVPSFFDYAKKGDVRKLPEVELTEEQWEAIDAEDKGIVEGVRHFLTFESGALAMVPIKTSFVGGIENTLDSHENVAAEVPSDLTVKDDTTAVGGDPEKAAKELIASLRKPQATPDAPPESDSLGDETPKTVDLQDETADDPKEVKESASDIAKRIIASVKGGNHPHDAMNDGDTATEKPASFDYNKEVINSVENANELEVVADKTGQKQMDTESVDVPSVVISQITTRISELQAAKAEFDDKGYNDTSVKQNAIDFLEKVKEHLSSADVQGLQQAQVLFQTLMSPITDLLPAALVKFLATARNSEKTSGTVPETN